MKRALPLLLAASCAPTVEPLVAPEIAGMRAALVVIEAEGAIEVHAHPLDGTRGLTIDRTRADRITVLFYAASIDRLGFARGPVPLAGPSGDRLPSAELVITSEDPGEGWIRATALPPSVDALRYASSAPRCLVPERWEIELDSAPLPSHVNTLLPAGPGRALAVTDTGQVFLTDGVTATERVLDRPVLSRAAWLDPRDESLWIGDGPTLRRVDLARGTTMESAVDTGRTDPILRVAGPDRAGPPFELFIANALTEIFHFDGARTVRLGRIDERTKDRDKINIHWLGPGQALITGWSPLVTRASTTALDRSLEPLPDDDCAVPSNASLVTSWRDGTYLVRTCIIPGGTDLELLELTASGDWRPAVAGLVDGDLLAAAPLGEGLLLAGEQGRYVQLDDRGGLCPALVYDDPNADPIERRHHFRDAVAIDRDTVVLSGQQSFEADSRRAHLVVMRFR